MFGIGVLHLTSKMEACFVSQSNCHASISGLIIKIAQTGLFRIYFLIVYFEFSHLFFLIFLSLKLNYFFFNFFLVVLCPSWTAFFFFSHSVSVLCLSPPPVTPAKLWACDGPVCMLSVRTGYSNRSGVCSKGRRTQGWVLCALLRGSAQNKKNT